MQGISSNHESLLRALNVLPHDDKRVEELKYLKVAGKRLAILGNGITCAEANILIGITSDCKPNDLLEAKFGQNKIINALEYGKAHERDAMQAYKDHLKATGRIRVSYYSPGIFACEDAPFIYATPHYIQTSPTPALLFTFNVHELTETIPEVIRIEVLCSLAITRGQGLPEKDAHAIIFLCPPNGAGAVHQVHFGNQEAKEWRRYRAKIVAFFTARMMPLMVTGLDIAALPEPAAAPQSNFISTDQLPPAPVDQTPSVIVGKRVREWKKRSRTGEVRELFPDGTADVDWDGEERKRKKRCKIDNLEVIPITEEQWGVPNQKGQTVLILAGPKPEFTGKTGIVEKLNHKFTHVAVNGQQIKIKNENLKLVGTSRQVTVPPAEYCLKIPLEQLDEFLAPHMRERNVRLIGKSTISKFVQEVRQAAEQLAANDGKSKERPKRNKKNKTN